MTTIEDIIRIAVNAHDGMKDMVGNPAIAHVLAAVDLLTHRPGTTYEDYVRNIVHSGNRTAIRVKLNDLHHNLHRAELALHTLDTSTRERQALLDEIMAIAAMHDRAERYIRNAVLPEAC